MTQKATSKRFVDGFALELPHGWKDLTEKGKGPITFGRPEGAGVLQFSAGIYRSGRLPEVSLADLREMLSDFSTKRQLGIGADIRVREEPLRSVGMSFSVQGRFLRVWYVSDGVNVALVTYNCRLGEEGDEVAECESIVDSIRFDHERPH
jgi:hypothetical protein